MNEIGEAITLWTVRLAFGCYVAAVSARGASFRPWWTAGFLLYVAHVGAAFEFVHGWSHGAAWRETERQTAELMGSGWGGGLWFNYVFGVLWAADVWRLWREADWGQWWNWLVHGFFAFLFFNATVVFGRGPIRWVGIAGFAWMAIVHGLRWSRK